VNPVHFAGAAAFRNWLEKHHDCEKELLVGFYNKASGRGGLTYPEALDEALCFGWIDGVRKRVDADSYTIRFSPRRPRSIWSRVNIGHVKRLTDAGKMHASGHAAFAKRDPKKSGVYSFEQRPEKLPAKYEAVIRKNPKAWAHWQQQPPGYRRMITWWVVSAKQEATRERRLARLIADAAAGRRQEVGTKREPRD
jgi:uncharacterized protein YdeI (YjbR/CyaY-like superfamily)